MRNVYDNRKKKLLVIIQVFPDTGLRVRNLTCMDQEGHRWDKDLPDCVGKSSAIFSKITIHIFKNIYLFFKRIEKFSDNWQQVCYQSNAEN